MERELIYQYFVDKEGEMDAPACREYLMHGIEEANDAGLICQTMYAKLEDTEFRIVETRSK
jgi:hypothetical protein